MAPKAVSRASGSRQTQRLQQAAADVNAARDRRRPAPLQQPAPPFYTIYKMCPPCGGRHLSFHVKNAYFLVEIFVSHRRGPGATFAVALWGGSVGFYYLIGFCSSVVDFGVGLHWVAVLANEIGPTS